jgi:ribonuclease HII
VPRALAKLLDDSKKLTPERRLAASMALYASGAAEIAVAAASVAEIERINILHASLLAMRRAVARLPTPPELALVDGNRPPDLPCAVQCVVGGDGLSLSIAAASIIAKVARDRLMARLAIRFPHYGWETNAGYGTPAHCQAMASSGISPHHRRGFAPVRAILAGTILLPAEMLAEMGAEPADDACPPSLSQVSGSSIVLPTAAP